MPIATIKHVGLRLTRVASLTLALVCPPVSAQSTIHDTFGAGTDPALYLIGDSPVDWVAAPFELTGGPTAILSELRFRLAAAYSQPTNHWAASLWSGASMDAAVPLESWLGIFTSPDPTTYSVLSVGTPLALGTTYWLALSYVDFEFGWAASDDGGLSPSHINRKWDGVWYDEVTLPYDGTNYELQPQFLVSAEIPAATVPEPATMTLLATGLFGLAITRRRRTGRNTR